MHQDDPVHLDGHQRQAVWVQQGHEHPAEEVVERREQQQREEARHDLDGPDRTTEIDEARCVRGGSGASSAILIVSRCSATRAVATVAIARLQPMPEESDAEATEHRGHREHDPVRRPDQPVGAIPTLLRHQERHRRRQRDHPQVARNRAEQDEDDERPEGRMGDVPDPRRGSDRVDHAGERERDERDPAREQHRRPAKMPVHEHPEEHPGHGDEQHVAAADDRGREDGARLEVDPERQGEPQEAARHVGDERVGDKQVEGTHQVLRMPDEPEACR